MLFDTSVQALYWLFSDSFNDILAVPLNWQWSSERGASLGSCCWWLGGWTAFLFLQWTVLDHPESISLLWLTLPWQSGFMKSLITACWMLLVSTAFYVGLSNDSRRQFIAPVYYTHHLHVTSNISAKPPEVWSQWRQLAHVQLSNPDLAYIIIIIMWPFT